MHMIIDIMHIGPVCKVSTISPLGHMIVYIKYMEERGTLFDL